MNPCIHAEWLTTAVGLPMTGTVRSVSMRLRPIMAVMGSIVVGSLGGAAPGVVAPAAASTSAAGVTTARPSAATPGPGTTVTTPAVLAPPTTSTSPSGGAGVSAPPVTSVTSATSTISATSTTSTTVTTSVAPTAPSSTPVPARSDHASVTGGVSPAAAARTSARPSAGSTGGAAITTVTPAAAAVVRWTFLSASSTGLATPQDIALSRLSAIMATGTRPPAFLVPIYRAAARRYDIPWTVLAAINAVETDYGRDLAVSSAGAEGWMQFMPATWARYGVSATGSGATDPYNPRDAIFSAARYLNANGGIHHLRQAIFAYNHAAWYVDEVLWLSEQISSRDQPSASSLAKLRLMLSTAQMLNGLPYVWGGGHGGWGFVSGYDCSGFVSAVLHAAGYLATPVTTEALPGQPGIVSGPGRWVTIFDRTDGSSATDDHVIIDIDGQWWESGGSSVAGVHRMGAVSASYLATFNLVLHPQSL